MNQRKQKDGYRIQPPEFQPISALCIAIQALRAWILSACPSETKTIRRLKQLVQLSRLLARTSKSEPVLATVQAEEQDQAVPASGESEEARSVEAPEPAAPVEDRQEEKEHREFEQAWTSC